ncbi:MAG: hypothetical protein RIB60_07235 [Phycisphaerales bacterium]
MRDENFQADASGGRDEIRDLAALLRAGADDELTPAEQARLDEHLAANGGDAARVAFERGLRAACGKAMGGERCPDALRATIERIVAESNPVYGEGIEAKATETRSASFWSSPRFVGVVGAAAAIALMFAIGGVLVGQPGASNSGNQLASGGATSDLQYVAYRNQVSRFVANEHNRCWESEEVTNRKFVMTGSTLADEFRNQLGSEVHIPALDQPVEQIKFRGGGKCHLPKTDATLHLRWDVAGEGGEPATAVSMFVAPDNGMLPLSEGVTYEINGKECGAEGASLLVWTKGGMTFFLVSDSLTGACDKFRKQMGAPAETEGL